MKSLEYIVFAEFIFLFVVITVATIHGYVTRNQKDTTDVEKN